MDFEFPSLSSPFLSTHRKRCKEHFAKRSDRKKHDRLIWLIPEDAHVGSTTISASAGERVPSTQSETETMEDSIEEPEIFIERNLYGHPLAGLLLKEN